MTTTAFFIIVYLAIIIVFCGFFYGADPAREGEGDGGKGIH